MKTWEVFQGRCCGVTDVIDRNLRGGTEESHEKPHSGYPVFQFILEPRTSRIEFYLFFNLLVYGWFCQGLIINNVSLCLIKHDTMKRTVEEV
jgi:hypothetical protein